MKRFLSLVKFSHTIFALPFAFIGFFLGVQEAAFDWVILGQVVLCMVFARNAAMGFNRYADRLIDARNERTAIREIPAGIITAPAVLIFVIVNVLLFVTTTWFINPLCFYLSPVALLVVLGYSYTKRFTSLSHFVLGIGLSLAPIGAYLAVTESFDTIPLLFSFAVLFWVSGFDIIYSLQDEDFDKEQKLFSIPAWLGGKRALLLSSFLHALTAAVLVGAGVLATFSSWYWGGSAIFIGLLIYQHTLVKPNDLSKVNLAFFTTNGFASVIFALFVILELTVA
jgi:4-hydroxybenzoate polyprenyltransferase